MTESKNSTYLPTLDGWRAIAILLVMLAHGTEKYFHANAPNANETLYHYTRLGSKGVDIFFVISGFLICTRLLLEQKFQGHISLKSFYVRRFFRIIPPYFFYLLTIFFLSLANFIYVSFSELTFSFAFIRNFLPNNWGQGDYTGHLWSIAIEEHFYLLFPAILIFTGAQKNKSKKSLITVMVLAVSIAVWRTLDFKFQFLRAKIPEIGFAARTDVRLDSLLWGAFFAILLSRDFYSSKIKKYLNTPAQIILLALFIFVLVNKTSQELLVQSILAAMLIISTINQPKNFLGIFLESTPMKWIGRISYSLYLWNSLFFIAFTAKLTAPTFAWLQCFPANIVMTFIMASVSYYFVEKPFIKLGYKIAKPNQKLNVNRERKI